MTRILTLCCVPILAAVLVQGQPPPGREPGHPGFGPGFMALGPGSRTPVTGAPYSGVQTSQFQQTLAGGNAISRQEQSKVYRDSQGRVRMEHTRTDGGQAGQTMITIFDPVAGVSYLLNPSASTAVKIPLPPAGSGSPMPHNPPPGLAGIQKTTDDLGTQVVNGVPATGTRITETIPAGAIGNAQPIQIVRETWVSTVLKVPVLIKSSDPRFGNSTMQLTNIVQSEPDAALFQVPSSYTVSARSEAMGPGARRMRRPVQ